MKYELQLIISGKSKVKHGTIIQAATGYLRRSQSSSKMAEGFKHFKKQEKETLERFIELNSLWILDINLEDYLSERAELQFIDTIFYIKDNFYEN